MPCAAYGSDFMQHIPAGDGQIRNILLTISYDGKAYHGWQVQQNALTVQEVFQSALEKIIGNDYSVKGCSRTDSGVHAIMYCIRSCEYISARYSNINTILPFLMIVSIEIGDFAVSRLITTLSAFSPPIVSNSKLSP